MNRIPIILDLFAGVLLGIDLFAPKWGNIFGRWVVDRFPNSNEARNPLHRKTILFNSSIAFYVFGMLMLWAMLKDTGSYTPLQLWRSIGLYAIGSFSGAIIITIMASIISKYVSLLQNLMILINTKLLRHNPVPSSETEDNHSVIHFTWIASLVITILLLYLATFLNSRYPFVFPILLSSIYVVVLSPIAMIYAPSFRKFIYQPGDKQIYVISRIGLILFVSTKFIQIFA